MKLFSYSCFSIFPLFYFIWFYGLFRSTIGCFLCNLSFELLESTSDVIALRLFLSEFILKFERHFIVSVLCFLKFDSGLVNLSQNVEILVFIHGSFISFIDEDMIFLSHFFYFWLHHSVVIIESIISIFSLADGQLKLLFDLFLNKIILTFDVMFYLRACSFASYYSSSFSYSYYSRAAFDSYYYGLLSKS